MKIISKQSLDGFMGLNRTDIDFTSRSLEIRKVNFIHRGIKYPFTWSFQHLQAYEKKQVKCSKPLEKYLFNILSGNFDIKLFNDKSIKRISQFRLNRLKRGMVPEIGEQLIKERIIKEEKTENKIVKIAENVHQTYSKIPEKKAGHNEILGIILKIDENSIATEIPIWSRDPPEPITGHIDLIRISNNCLNVVDYKPEGNFMRSIPQVAYYGLLLNKILRRKVICSSFNRYKIWNFEPTSLFKRINEILSDLTAQKFDWQPFLNFF